MYIVLHGQNNSYLQNRNVCSAIAMDILILFCLTGQLAKRQSDSLKDLVKGSCSSIRAGVLTPIKPVLLKAAVLFLATGIFSE